VQPANLTVVVIRRQGELVVDMRDVLHNCFLGDRQSPGDCGVAAFLGYQSEYLLLALC
jgi:hypothetical protein